MKVANPMFRTMMMRAMRTSYTRGVFGAFVLAASSAVLSVMTTSQTWMWIYRGSIALWVLIGIALLFVMRKALARPALRELFERPGSIVLVSTGQRVFRIVLK